MEDVKAVVEVGFVVLTEIHSAAVISLLVVLVGARLLGSLGRRGRLRRSL